MAFDKGNPKVTPADQFISGKSAHALLAAIAAGTLPEGVTPAMIGQADVERTARKLATRDAAA
jgi:hypothetical protein